MSSTDVSSSNEEENTLSHGIYTYAYDQLNRTVKTTLENKIDNTTSVIEENVYNPVNNVIYQKTDEGVTRTIYDEYGRVVQEITSEDYDKASDNIAEKTDSYADKNVGARYIYAENGNLSKEINRLDVTTYYQYYEKSSVVKTETFDLYKYTYDKNGNMLDVYIGGKTNSSGAYTGGDLYAKYTYADDGTLSYVKYGNDQTVSYEYNQFSQVTKQKYKASPDAQEKVQYEYVYTQNAQDEESSVLKEKYDYESMQKTVYDENGKVSIYCLDDRMVLYNPEESEHLYYSYYETDETTNEQGEKVPGKIEYDCLLNDISITKNENGYSLLTDYENTYLKYTSQLKDGRLSAESVKNKDEKTILETSYTYNEKGYAESITSKSFDGKESETSYKYDDKGRITEYTCDGKTVYYTYDSKGQLIREDGHGKTMVYTYDQRGNFKSTREYEFTRGEIDTNPVYTEYFEVKYNDTAWLDKITGVDDDDMVYDLMGNLVGLDECTIKWTNGRQMSEVVSNETGETVLELLYDDNGILTQKTDYEGTTYYTNIDGNFTTQYTEGGKYNLPIEQMQFIYDDNNQVTALCFNTAMYYYVKNAMGDVIGIVNEDGKRVCTYEYDAWGNVLNTYHYDSTGIDYNVGERNPIRYRSYYFDNSIGFYYLQSRFYFSSMARFINADLPIYAQKQKDLNNGINLFAYCNNDPVNSIDPDGEFRITPFLKIQPVKKKQKKCVYVDCSRIISVEREKYRLVYPQSAEVFYNEKASWKYLSTYVGKPKFNSTKFFQDIGELNGASTVDGLVIGLSALNNFSLDYVDIYWRKTKSKGRTIKQAIMVAGTYADKRLYRENAGRTKYVCNEKNSTFAYEMYIDSVADKYKKLTGKKHLILL